MRKTAIMFNSAHPISQGAPVVLTDAMRVRSPCAAGVAAGLAMAVALAGCGTRDDADDFRQGVPQHEDVAIIVPGSSQDAALTSAGVVETRQALLGETAELYQTTRSITAMVNGGTVAVLGLVKTITAFQPTSVGPDVAVWGPHTNPLEQRTWRLTVHRVGPGQYQYTFEAKPRGGADSGYLVILSGHHNVANPGMHRRPRLPAFGSGDFELNWDNSRMLPGPEENFGKAAFVYSRPAPLADANVAVTFTQVKDKETGMLIDAQYGYVETPGNGGSFQFTLTKDAIPTTAALETLTVHSRWQETGEGRADVKLTGGDLAAPATASECWSSGDSGFLSLFFTNSYGDSAKMWGAETDCHSAFRTAAYAAF